MQTVKHVPIEVAILVQGGVVQSIISNCQMLKVHVVDVDNDTDAAAEKWCELETELEAKHL